MNRSKSSLFLMELIIGLLFFSLASTICISLFVKSHTISTYTKNLNYAVTQSQNMAEAFLGLDGDMEQMRNVFPKSILNEQQTMLTVYDNEYHSILQLQDSDDNQTISEGKMVSANIFVYSRSDQSPIYTLHIDHYIAEREVSNDSFY